MKGDTPTSSPSYIYFYIYIYMCVCVFMYIIFHKYLNIYYICTYMSI